MHKRTMVTRKAKYVVLFAVLHQSASCGRSEAAPNRADSLTVVKQLADSLADALRKREEAEKQRVADSIAADRVRPRVLTLYENDTRTIAYQSFEQKGIYLPARGNCVLKGRVEAILGGSRDVSVYVFTDDEFINWKNGGTASALFQSGPKTITNIDLPLPDSGKFRLVISNRHSFWTEKAIRAEASARCIGAPMPQALR